MDQEPEYTVYFYRKRNGESPADHFLDCLSENVRGKVFKWIAELESHGPSLPRPFADIVRGKIRELRVRFGSNHYRFLYFFSGKKIVITHRFLKKQDKVPVDEIERAERYMKDFLFRLEKGEYSDEEDD